MTRQIFRKVRSSEILLGCNKWERVRDSINTGCLMQARLVISRATVTSSSNFNEKCNYNRISMNSRIRRGCSISKTFDSELNLTLKTWSKRHCLNQNCTRAALTQTLTLCHFTSQRICPSMDNAWPSVARIFQSTWSERRNVRMNMKMLVGKRASPTLQDNYKRRRRKKMSSPRCMLKNIKK